MPQIYIVVTTLQYICLEHLKQNPSPTPVQPIYSYIFFMQDDVKSYQREIALLQDKERQLNDKIKASMTKLRAEQEEVPFYILEYNCTTSTNG